MGPIGWIMLIVHVALFFYLRRRYVRKKNIAEKAAAEYKAENINLQSQLQSYKDLLG